MAAGWETPAFPTDGPRSQARAALAVAPSRCFLTVVSPDCCNLSDRCLVYKEALSLFSRSALESLSSVSAGLRLSRSVCAGLFMPAVQARTVLELQIYFSSVWEGRRGEREDAVWMCIGMAKSASQPL